MKDYFVSYVIDDNKVLHTSDIKNIVISSISINPCTVSMVIDGILKQLKDKHETFSNQIKIISISTL